MGSNNIPHNSDLMVISSNEAASIIERFAPDMIRDVVYESIQSRYDSSFLPLPNLPEVLEKNYRMHMDGIPEYSAEIMSSRHNTFLNIIQQVCAHHNLTYLFDENDDIYTAAYYIYDFLVSGFVSHLVNYFTMIIYRQKSTICEAISLSEHKKDVSNYSKKIYSNDSELALIHSNLDTALSTVCEFDTELAMYVEFACAPDRTEAKYLNGVLADNGDFFKRVILPYYQQNYAPLTTHILMALQGFGSEGANQDFI